MFKRSALALLALLPIHAVAAAEPGARTIELDGQRVDYRRTLDADGILHFRGTSGGEPFHLRVSRSGRISGRVAGRPVETKVSRATRDRAARAAPVNLATR